MRKPNPLLSLAAIRGMRGAAAANRDSVEVVTKDAAPACSGGLLAWHGG
jgi:hypothetical protein